MSDLNLPFTSVYEAFVASAERNPDKAAIVYEGEVITYSTLLGWIDNTASHLATLGIERGSSFAAYAQNRPELMFCYYAAAKIGAVFVPLNPNLTSPEVEYAFRHSGARVLFHDDAVAEAASAAVPAEALVSLHVLRETAAVGARMLDAATPEDDFLIIYTSGTTGAPKAIVLDQAAQIQGAAALAGMWDVSEADVTLVALPLGYLYGLSTAAAVGLQSGGTVVILRRFHPRDVLEGLVAHKASIFHGVPTMFSMMLEYCEQRHLSFDLSGARELICAGAPLPEEMRQRFAARFGKALQNYYAMTEATPVFGKFASDPVPIPEKAVGKAAPGLTIKILRPDGSECAVGEQGEIQLRAAATMKRYLNAPEQTNAAMQDGLFRSGDLGYRDADGYYYITGRIKDIIIRGGANISPSEVEEVLASHPGVQDVAVVGAPDRIFGEVPVAFVVRRHGASITEEDLIAHAEAVLSDFKVPRRYYFETELPHGKTGKIDKAALKQRCAEAMVAN